MLSSVLSLSSQLPYVPSLCPRDVVSSVLILQTPPIQYQNYLLPTSTRMEATLPILSFRLFGMSCPGPRVYCPCGCQPMPQHFSCRSGKAGPVLAAYASYLYFQDGDQTPFRWVSRTVWRSTSIIIELSKPRRPSQAIHNHRRSWLPWK
jgi:hypothetical protein